MKKLLFLFLAMFMSLSVMASQSIQLSKENSVSLRDVVHSGSVSKVIQELAKKETNDESVIYLVLDTPGGSVFAGIDLINYLKAYKKPVHTITSFAASMGFQIAQGNQGKRLISPTGVLMSHPMSGGMGGEMGDNMSMDRRHGFLKEIIKTMDLEVVARTNGKQTLESYQKEYDNELWTTGQNAVDLGYADEVSPFGCDSSLSESIDKHEYRSYLGQVFSLQVKYELSSCPLISAVLRYEVAIVNIIDESKYILSSEGYDLTRQNLVDSNLSDLKNKGANTTASSNSAKDDKKQELPLSIREAAMENPLYKNLQFYLTRDFKTFKKQSNL